MLLCILYSLVCYDSSRGTLRCLNAIAEDEWVEVDVAVDSGATETVMSEETLSGVIDKKVLHASAALSMRSPTAPRSLIGENANF